MCFLNRKKIKIVPLRDSRKNIKAKGSRIICPGSSSTLNHSGFLCCFLNTSNTWMPSQTAICFGFLFLLSSVCERNYKLLFFSLIFLSSPCFSHRRDTKTRIRVSDETLSSSFAVLCFLSLVIPHYEPYFMD